MYRLATKRTTKKTSGRNAEACIGIAHLLLRLRGHWSSCLSGCFRSVHKRRPTRSDSSARAVRRPELVTEFTETDLIVRQYLRTDPVPYLVLLL